MCCFSHLYLVSLSPISKDNNYRNFSSKTSPCYTIKHPGVLCENIPMFWGTTSGCFRLLVVMSKVLGRNVESIQS
ncbi:hypothetical protein DXC10_04590 [Bacteroides sp. OM08-11]|nr:hypothetical protein DXC10_04590 [Bacteroides sp. OM08-11]